LDLQLLLSLSRQNIFLTTACVAFHKYDLDTTIDIIEQLHNHFEENFYLEVQCHKMELQQKINKFLIGMSKKYDIPLIMGTDSHYIYPKDSQIRVDFLHSKNLYYEDEEGCILDYPSTYEVIERFEKQRVLSESQIEQAINNTNVFLSFEDITFNKNIKLPTIYKGKTQEEKNKIFTDLIDVKWNKYKQNVPNEAIPKYEKEIRKEVDCVKNTGMADYFLLDYEIVEKAKKKGGRITLTGRGSAAGFFTTTLLGFSKIDRLQAPVKMYPERFMSETRILQTRSLPDLDLNTGNPDIFLESQDEVLGTESSYQMIAFGKYKVKSAFKLYAKSQNIPFNIANTISQQIEAYELDYKHADDDMKDLIDVYNYVDKEYHDIIRDSEKYQNLISDKKPAPCASLIYQGNIKEEIGLIKIKGKNGKKDVLVAAIDGNAAEDYKYLKNDLLKVDVVNIIYDTFHNIGQEPFSVNELIEITKNDDKVWDIYAKGLTVCLNQVEKESTKQKIMRYKPKNISELTSFIAAIRPSFQSMYAIYEKRQKFVYGIKAFDDLLQDEYMTSSFLLYQEQIMATLNYAGIDQSETYGIIKAIAKKKIDKIMKWKDIFINGFKKKVLETESISEEEALEKTMQV